MFLSKRGQRSAPEKKIIEKGLFVEEFVFENPISLDLLN